MLRTTFFFTVAVILLIGCQQDPAVPPANPIPPSPADTTAGDTVPPVGTTTWDTIYPKCYFPAWPGSYWTYEDLDGHQTTHTAGPFLLRSNYNPWFAPTDTSHCCWVATYDSLMLMGYALEHGVYRPAPSDSPWAQLIPDSIYLGEHFDSFRIYPATEFYGEVLSTDSTMVVHGVTYPHTLIIGIGPYWGLYTQVCAYVCGVGMIRRTDLEFETGQVLAQEDLVDYHVTH